MSQLIIVRTNDGYAVQEGNLANAACVSPFFATHEEAEEWLRAKLAAKKVKAKANSATREMLEVVQSLLEQTTTHIVGFLTNALNSFEFLLFNTQEEIAVYLDDHELGKGQWLEIPDRVVVGDSVKIVLLVLKQR